MDAQHVDYTRQHYDSHVRSDVSTKQARRSRAAPSCSLARCAPLPPLLTRAPG